MDQSIEVQRELQRYAKAKLAKIDPYYFFGFLKTKDEHDPDVPRKPFPQTVILRVTCRFFEEFNLGFIEKSRQIMMSWIFCGLFLWDAMHRNNRRHFVRDKKEDDAAAKLDRQKFMIQGLKDDGYPNLPDMKMVGEKIGTATSIEFPGMSSSIEAMAQGSGQAAGFTNSGIFDDEINLQPEAQQGYEWAFPTIKGGGRYFAVGTPNGHTFGWRMMRGINENTGKPAGRHLIDSRRLKRIPIVAPDTGDAEQKRYWTENAILRLTDKEFKEMPFERLVACCPGIDYWRTCDGVDVLSIHYSADPDKSPDTEKGRAWIAEEKRGISKSGWLRQYELNYDTYDGRPVIPNWNESIFVGKPEYDYRRPLLVAFDFGKSCCAIFAQEQLFDGFSAKQMVILDEIFLENSNTLELLTHTIDKLESQFLSSWESNNIQAYCDPAGNQERETTSDRSLNSSVKILNSGGIFPFSQKFGVPESTQQVETIFSLMYPNGEPAIKVHERCKYLIACYGGGWHYPKEKGREGFPEKDGRYEHGGDTTRYLLCNRFEPSDFTRKRQAPSRTILVRQKGTGRILGRRRINSNRANRRRGRHAVRL